MFNEANAVENFIRDLLAGKPKPRQARDGSSVTGQRVSAALIVI